VTKDGEPFQGSGGEEDRSQALVGIKSIDFSKINLRLKLMAGCQSAGRIVSPLASDTKLCQVPVKQEL
jgi:hypothetical protein